MDKETALRFLKLHQPMPDDDCLDHKTISMYDDVRKYFLNNPDKDCLPLFLNSFGKYDGYGVYQLVEDVILKFEHEEVVNCLMDSLRSHHDGVKYWCVQISASFPDVRLIPSLKDLLNDPNEDIRIFAVTALSLINDERAIQIIMNHSEIEKNETVESIIIELLSKNKKEIIEKINQTDNSEILHLIADNYNWDNGFEIPDSIINNMHCDLGTALMLFYDADGYSVLKDKKELENTDSKDRVALLMKIIEKISKEEFTSKHIEYVPPLSKVQKYNLKKDASINRVFIDGTVGDSGRK